MVENNQLLTKVAPIVVKPNKEISPRAHISNINIRKKIREQKYRKLKKGEVRKVDFISQNQKIEDLVICSVRYIYVRNSPTGFRSSSLCLPPLPYLTCCTGLSCSLESRAECLCFLFSLSVRPYFPALGLRPGLYQTQVGIPSEGPSLTSLTSSTLTSDPPPPAGLNRRPIPLTVLRGFSYVLHNPLYLVHPTDPTFFCAISLCVLVSCVFVGRNVSPKRNWGASTTGNKYPRPSPLRYLDMLFPLRLPPPLHVPVPPLLSSFLTSKIYLVFFLS